MRIEGGNSEDKRRNAVEARQGELALARQEALNNLRDINTHISSGLHKSKEESSPSWPSVEEATRAALTLNFALRRALKGNTEATFEDQNYIVRVRRGNPYYDKNVNVEERAQTPWKEPTKYDLEEAKRKAKILHLDNVNPISTRPCRTLYTATMECKPPSESWYVPLSTEIIEYKIKDTYDDTAQVNVQHSTLFADLNKMFLEDAFFSERMSNLSEAQQVAGVMRLLFETEV